MASNANKKLLLFYVLQILREDSDSEHPIMQKDIAKKIEQSYGMECDRKTISANIEYLKELHFDVAKIHNKGVYLVSRELEPSEITFLIDAVFSSKSISSKRSKELIEKLQSILSTYQRKKYKYVIKSNEVNRINNDQIFYIIDVLSDAIEQGKQVEFNYNRYYFDKNKNEEHKQKKHIINPYFMVNNQGRYYLVCNNNNFNDISNYKIELISNIKILDSNVKPITSLDGCQNGVDMVKYANQNFYMFNSNTVEATLKIDTEYAANYIIDWFGDNSTFFAKDEQVFANITANEDALIYWCLQYGEHIQLVEPQSTRQKIQQQIAKLQQNYK